MFKECKWLPVLKSERLTLRKLVPEDAADLKEWFGLDIVYKYWGRPAGSGEKNPETMFVDPRPHVKRKPTHDFIWAIEFEHKVIGIIEVFDVENDRMGMIGYRISPAYWRKGICSEALQQVVTFIFTETKFDRLCAEADVENIGSNAVLRKCGFVHEGCIRHGKMGIRYCDYNIYGMIRDDFEEVMKMFSEELRQLDRNTVQYMIDEMQEENDRKAKIIEEKDQVIEEKDQVIEKKNQTWEKQEREIQELKRMLAEQQDH